MLMETPAKTVADPFRHHEWNEIVNWIFENFTKEELQRVISFYKEDRELENMAVDEGESEETWQQTFYNTIDFVDDKIEAAEKLLEVMKMLHLHSVEGVNVADKVQQFIDRMKEFLKMFELETKQLFIGRDKEVKQVIDLLNEDKIVAVCLCGIGGQGKSRLASEVCRKMAFDTPFRSLKIVKADLRDKPRLEDAIRSLLASAGVKFSTSGDRGMLESCLEQYIVESESDILFCLDDCDMVLNGSHDEFLQFLDNILKVAEESKQKIRFLLTMRVKLLAEVEKTKLFGRVKSADKVREQMAEVELSELEKSDAEELLKKSSGVEMDGKVASDIVKVCACSPLAVTVVAGLLESGKFTPDRLLFHLEMDTKNVTKGMKVNNCIKEVIERLNTNLQKALVSLSVFQSSPFTVKDACKIIGTELSQMQALSDFEGNPLQALYNCHLIEVELKTKSRSEDVQGKELDERRSTCSLHPLVYRYVSEWKKTSELSAAFKTATQKFVAMYEGIISDIVKLLESKYWKGQEKLERHRVHILKFYEIMSDHAELLEKHPKKTDDKGLLIKKRVSDLADILISLVQTRRMVQSEADRALKQKNHAVYIYWMVEKADVFLMLHDKVDIALKMLNELSDKYPALRDLRDEVFYPRTVHGLFHKVKGLCRWKQRRHQDSLKHLQLSIKFFNSPTTLYDNFVAKLNCYMGQVYLDNGDLDQADAFLRKGHELSKKMVQPRQRDPDELAKERHWDIPRYYLNFAKIKLLKAKSAKFTNDEHAREQLLDKALEDLGRGIRLDEHLKLDYLDGYYSKLKLRADVNVEKGLLAEALKDADYVLDRRRTLLQPPHTHYTESVYQVGRIYMMIGNDKHKKGDEDAAHRHWKFSSDYFRELKECHLKDGGISLDNPVFQEIKKDHIQVTELTGNKSEVKKMVEFYKRLEGGAFEPERVSSLAAMKKMLWTPLEVVKTYFGGGGDEFGDKDQEIAKLENLARIQRERMIQGEPSGGARRDSGMGHSSSDYGESVSSGSGSMSERMNRLHLEKSISVEDEVFQDPSETATVQSTHRVKKRQKTIDESPEPMN